MRSSAPQRTAAVAAALIALAGCSFRGSADDPDAARGSRSTSPSASTPSGSTPSGSTSSAAAPVSTGAPASSTAPPPGSAGAPSPSSGAATPSSSAAGGAEPTVGHGPSGGQGVGGSTGSAAAVDRCHTGELAGRLVVEDSAAGHHHAALVLTDTGGRTCTVEGYGGVGLVDAQGRALPTDQVRVSSPAPALVTLRPGGTATSQLSWGVVPGEGDGQNGQCQPTPATLRVIPPNETDALSVPWPDGPVCEVGTLQQQAYAAG